MGIFLCAWSHGLWPKKPYAGVAVPPASFRVPIQKLLARVSRQSTDDGLIIRSYWRLCTDLLTLLGKFQN